MGWIYLSIPKLRQFEHCSLGMDTSWRPVAPNAVAGFIHYWLMYWIVAFQHQANVSMRHKHMHYTATIIPLRRYNQRYIREALSKPICTINNIWQQGFLSLWISTQIHILMSMCTHKFVLKHSLVEHGKIPLCNISSGYISIEHRNNVFVSWQSQITGAQRIVH